MKTSKHASPVHCPQNKVEYLHQQGLKEYVPCHQEILQVHTSKRVPCSQPRNPSTCLTVPPGEFSPGGWQWFGQFAGCSVWPTEDPGMVFGLREAVGYGWRFVPTAEVWEQQQIRYWGSSRDNRRKIHSEKGSSLQTIHSVSSPLVSPLSVLSCLTCVSTGYRWEMQQRKKNSSLFFCLFVVEHVLDCGGRKHGKNGQQNLQAHQHFFQKGRRN